MFLRFGKLQIWEPTNWHLHWGQTQNIIMGKSQRLFDLEFIATCLKIIIICVDMVACYNIFQQKDRGAYI